MSERQQYIGLWLLIILALVFVVITFNKTIVKGDFDVIESDLDEAEE